MLDNKKMDNFRYVSLNSLSPPITFLLPICQSQSYIRQRNISLFNDKDQNFYTREAAYIPWQNRFQHEVTRITATVSGHLALAICFDLFSRDTEGNLRVDSTYLRSFLPLPDASTGTRTSPLRLARTCCSMSRKNLPRRDKRASN